VKVLDIDSTTRLPVAIVWVLIVICVGGAGWATTQTLKMDEAQANIIALQGGVDAINLDRSARRDQITNKIHNLELQVVAIREHFRIPPPREMSNTNQDNER
jgi:hypothetical protein